MFLYSILDIKSKTFGSLAEARTDDEAIRSFIIAIQKAPQGSLLHDFPVDFSLFRLGAIDYDDGSLYSETQPIQLITGLDVLKMSNTCSEVAVRDPLPESDNVAEKSTEEEVNVQSNMEV